MHDLELPPGLGNLLMFRGQNWSNLFAFNVPDQVQLLDLFGLHGKGDIAWVSFHHNLKHRWCNSCAPLATCLIFPTWNGSKQEESLVNKRGNGTFSAVYGRFQLPHLIPGRYIEAQDQNPTSGMSMAVEGKVLHVRYLNALYFHSFAWIYKCILVLIANHRPNGLKWCLRFQTKRKHQTS